MSYFEDEPERRRRPMSTAVAVAWVSAMLILAIVLMSYVAVQWWA